jgi:hypothetical protein
MRLFSFFRLNDRGKSMPRPKIRKVYVVIDCAYNRAHYGQLIGRAFLVAPLFARYRIA